MRFESAFRRRRRLIGLAPLIDVVFILLLFFMLTTNFTRWRELPFELPAAASELSPDSVRSLELRADGLLRHGGRAFAGGQREALRAFVAEAPNDIYLIDAAGVPTQALVDWLDRLQFAGAKRLSLANAPP